jgi:hypothetical protein
MPIDPSILFKAQPLQLENPVNAMAKAMQLRAMQDESDVNSLRREDLQQTFNERKGLNTLFADPNFKFGTPESLQQIAKVAPGQLAAYQRLYIETEKERRLAKNAELEGLTKTLAVGRDMAAAAQNQEQWDGFRGFLKENAPSMLGSIPGMFNIPNKEATIMTADKLAGIIAEKMKGFNIPAGGGRFEPSPLGGAPQMVASMPALPVAPTVTPVPGSGNTPSQFAVVHPSRSNEPTKFEFIKMPENVGARVQPPQKQTAKVFHEESGRELLIDPSVYQGGGLGSPGVIGPVAPSAAAAKATKEQEDKDKAYTAFKNEIDDILVRFRKLDAMKAVTSTKAGVVENLGRAASGSALGQFAGRITGSEAQKERDVIIGSNSRLLGQIAQITGRAVSQLNTDKELTFFLKSLSDPANTSVEAAEDNLAKLVAYVEILATKPPLETTTTTPRTTAPKAVAPKPAATGGKRSLDDIMSGKR